MKRYFFLVLLLVCQFLNSQLTRLQFNHISQLDGLSQSEPITISQDNKGYIWIGTRNGLNRYNGYSFEVYTNNPFDSTSISSNNIRSICNDKNGNLWIGTRGGGLSLYNPKTNNFTSFKHSDTIANSLASDEVGFLLESKDGLMLVSNSPGLTVFSTKDPNYLAKPTFKKIFDNHINTIVETYNNIFWLGAGDGIYKVKIENDKFEVLNHFNEEKDKILADKINTIYAESNSIIWAGTDNGLIRIHDNNGAFTFNYYQEKDGLKSNIITVINEDAIKNLLIGTQNGGLSIFNRATNKFTNYATNVYYQKNISGNMVNCIFEDKTGVLWIGINGKGVNNIDLRHYKFEDFKIFLKNQQELPSNFVRAIYQDEDNVIWLGTIGGGMFKYDRDKDEYYTFDFTNNANKIIQSGYNVFNIQKFEDDKLLIGSNQGLCIYDKISGKFTYYRKDETNPEGLASGTILSIEKDDNGVFWVGTLKGLHKFNYEKGNFERFEDINSDPKSSSNNSITYIYNDPINTDMWIGTAYNGLSRMITDSKTGKVEFMNYVYDPNNPNSLSDIKVNMVLRTKKGDIWVATDNGLNKMLIEKDQKKPSFIRYTVANGLSNNSVKSILEDENGNLWMGTNDKLSMLNPETKVFTNYSYEDGLQGNEFGLLACFKGNNGEFFFGGAQGYNSFFPSKIKSNNYEPQIVLTNFYVSKKLVRMGDTINGRVILDEPIDQIKEITLSYKENYISFEFAALHFSSPGKNKYAYKLEGLDTTWYYTDAKQRIASFMNLEGGEYTLRIKASNNDGVWNDEGISIKITIVPPFWKTIWFRILAILLIIAIAALWFTNRTRELKNNQLRLQQEVENATSEVKKKNEKLKEAQQKLGSIVDEVKESLSKTSYQLSEAAVSQAATVEEVSATIEQITEGLHINAENSNDIHKQAIDVSQNAENSFTIVSKAVNAMQKISSEIGLISDVAKRLKFLSLNAAIESSRAGLEGRGFSVIASEFKKLSESTQEFAISIKDVSGMGFTLSKEANEKINDLLVLIKNIVSLIDKINEANQNQSAEVKSINIAVQDLAIYINKTADLAKTLDYAINNLTFDAED